MSLQPLFEQEGVPGLLLLGALVCRHVALDVLHNLVNARLLIVVPAQGVHKLALRVHEVEEDGVVHQVVLAWLDVWWCGEVHPVLLARVFHLVERTRQPQDGGMKVAQVLLQNRGRVSCRVASDKERLQGNAVLRRQVVEPHAQLVQLIGTDVGTVAEPEVQYGKLAEEIFLCELITVHVLQMEGPAQRGLPVPSVGLCLLLSLNSALLPVEEVRDCPSDCEEQGNGLSRGKLDRTLARRPVVLRDGCAAHWNSTQGFLVVRLPQTRPSGESPLSEQFRAAATHARSPHVSNGTALQQSLVDTS